MIEIILKSLLGVEVLGIGLGNGKGLMDTGDSKSLVKLYLIPLMKTIGLLVRLMTIPFWDLMEMMFSLEGLEMTDYTEMTGMILYTEILEMIF